MKHFAHVAPSGQIMMAGTCGDADFVLQQPLSGTSIIESPTPVRHSTHYWDGSGFLTIPPCPGSGLTFHYETGMWEDFRTLDDLRLERRAYVTAQRDITLGGGFTYNGDVYDSNAQSRANISSQARLAVAVGPTFETEWTLANNTLVTLDQGGMLALETAMDEHVATVYAHARALKQTIAAATTPTEIAAVQWGLPVPT